jgi:predicted N-acetyltransferase YhbS
VSGSAPQIRIAQASDLDALHSLVERAYRGDAARGGWTHEADLLGGQRTDAESLASILADPAQRILLATEDDVVTGCVQISDKGEGLAYLGLLSVDPKLQARHLGRRLMEAAEEAAMRLFAARRMEMTVLRQRPKLIAYYERRGYALTGEERPFPLDDPRFGLPRTRDLAFVVLAKDLHR